MESKLRSLLIWKITALVCLPGMKKMAIKLMIKGMVKCRIQKAHPTCEFAVVAQNGGHNAALFGL